MTIFNDSTFTSLSQGFGTATDKNLDYFVTSKSWNQKTYDLIVEINNLAANIVEKLPNSMGVKPAIYKVTEEGDTPQEIEINQRIEGLTKHFVKATKIARQCGGSGLFLGNSDLDLTLPLSSAPIEFYTVFQGGKDGFLRIKEIDKNALGSNYEKPLLYQLKNKEKSLIHHTRIIPFYGIELISTESKKRFNYWGLPVLHRSYDKLKNLDIADQSIAQTISQFSRLVYEIDNLTTHLGSEKGKEVLKARLELLNYSWNVLKTLLVQTGEKVYNLKVDYTGLNEMLMHFKQMLCSSADLPYALLFNSGGDSSSLGGNDAASGSINRTSERQWSDYVNTTQKDQWYPGMVYIINHWLGIDRVEYELKFPSILQLTQEEEAKLEQETQNARKIRLEADKIESELTINPVE